MHGESEAARAWSTDGLVGEHNKLGLSCPQRHTAVYLQPCAGMDIIKRKERPGAPLYSVSLFKDLSRNVEGMKGTC